MQVYRCFDLSVGPGEVLPHLQQSPQAVEGDAGGMPLHGVIEIGARCGV